MEHIRRTLAWWYWLATIGLLGPALVAPSPGALGATIALTAVQVVHFCKRTGALRAFPVQIRFAFLVLLLAGTWTPLGFIHWMQLAGTTVRVVFDYCVLARTMSLMPWNRSGPLDSALLRRTYLTAPSRWRFAPPARGMETVKGTQVRVRA